MAYELRYDLTFLNRAGDTCLLELYEDRTGDPIDQAQLTGSATPVVMRSIDNDRDPFTPIRGHELTAEIVTTSLGIADFMSDDDLKWKGVFKVNGGVVFTGFLVQEDSQEDFVDYARTLRLTFTDGIGLLKGVPLTDAGGLPWHDTPTVYAIIRACLNKTGQTLPIRIRCNLFPSDTVDVTATAGMAISKIYTRSFMTNERDFQDCYSVLSDIMRSWGCMLYQYRGEWVVDRVGDRHEGATSEFVYDTADVVTYVGTTYDAAAIGQGEEIQEVQSPLLLRLTRAARENKMTYFFKKWPELIRNLDLDEGAQVVLLSDSTQRTYDLDYWTKVNRVAYSRRVIDSLGNETDRYLFINGAADNLDLVDYVQSQTFPATKGDRITFSFSACSKNDLPTTAAIVYLKCGSYYLDDDGTWSTGATFLRLDFASAENSTLWKTYNIESLPIPADGDVEIRLLLMQGCAAGNETRYKDIVIDYTQVIGTSTKATGDFNNYTNSVTKKNPIGEQVYLSDSLRKTNCGALLKSSGALETGWQRGSLSEIMRFTQFNAFAYYQHSRRSKMIFEGVFLGTKWGGGDPVGFWPQYTIADAPGKTFMPTSIDEVDFLSGEWRGTVIEVNDDTLDTDIATMGSNFDYNFIFGG